LDAAARRKGQSGRRSAEADEASATQRQAAREAGVSAERVRRFQMQNTTSRREDAAGYIIDLRQSRW